MGIRLREHLMWVPALAVLAFVLATEDEPMASIGWSLPTNTDMRAGVFAFIGGLLLFQVLSTVIARIGMGNAVGRVEQLVAGRTTVALVLGSVTAGITEEIVFRGFLLERIGDALGSYAFAGVLTCGGFVVAHRFFWDASTTVAIVGPSVALTWLYVATRNLPVCIAVHVANDLWAFLVAPRALERLASRGRDSESPGTSAPRS